MGNIIAFLARHHRFFIFVLLEAICFSIIVNYNKNQGSVFFKGTADLTGSIDATFSGINAYFNLKSANDSLKHENARLRSAMKSAYFYDTARSKTFTDTTRKQHYNFVVCNVVNNSVNNRNNYIMVDAGASKGLSKDLGVVTTSGIAGVTREVSAHFTSVLSVLHKDFSVSAEITEIKEVGNLIWDGANPEIAILKDIPLHIRIKKGMHVATSQYSDLFPTGTAIGIVTDYKIKAAEPFYTIYVKLASDMRNLRNVYVVNNLMKEEQKKIEPKPEKP